MTSTAKMASPGRAKLTGPSSSYASLASSASNPDLLRLSSDLQTAGSGDDKNSTALPVTEEEQALDELAQVFTIHEERYLSSRAGREGSRTSKESLALSRTNEVSFIYQQVNFQVLSKCMPGFVKSHLNKNGRYLPETFILRVNYWRRRRALGDDSTAKRVAKETAARMCGAAGPPTDEISSSSPTPRVAASSARSPMRTSAGNLNSSPRAASSSARSPTRTSSSPAVVTTKQMSSVSSSSLVVMTSSS